jgi:4-aminobutyrate aminotransferase
LTLAKGIASGLPLSATIASETVMNWKPGAHASTFGGNPVACAAAHATLDLLESELVAQSASVGNFLLALLRERLGAHPNVGDIRGLGLMIGIELVTDRSTKERAIELRNNLVMDAFHRHGLVILGCGQNSIRLCPGLVCTEDEARVCVDILVDSLAHLTGAAHA